MSRSLLLGTAGLGVAAMAALVLTLVRRPVERSSGGRRADWLLAAAAILVHACHFGEELTTGFHVQFPAALGLEAWPLRFFVGFNVAWLAVWIVAAAALGTRRRAAFFPIWFLGIASIANGVAHPLLAARAGGYFPGLATAPVAGLAGALLVRRLMTITAAAEEG